MLQENLTVCDLFRERINLFGDKYNDRLISKNVYVSSSQRSCNITLLDILLWGYVGLLAHSNKPRIPNELNRDQGDQGFSFYSWNKNRLM